MGAVMFPMRAEHSFQRVTTPPESIQTLPPLLTTEELH